MNDILHYNFFIYKECFEFSKKRRKRGIEYSSKRGKMTFIKRNENFYLIDGYHRLMDLFIYDCEIQSLKPEIVFKPHMKLNYNDFIHFENIYLKNDCLSQRRFKKI